MRALGFRPKALGPDGPAAHTEAVKLYESWLKVKTGGDLVVSYPAGSFGAYYERFKRTKAFARKKPRTREDYDRAWKHLGPAFGSKILTKISAADVEDFLEDLEKIVSENERYRVLKILRAIFADAIIRLKLNMPSPARAVSNPQPLGRSQIWLGSEIDQLVAGAHELGHHGMAVAILIAWDTLFSPVDVYSVTKAALKRDGSGWYLERDRTKTDKGAFGALSDSTASELLKYLADLGVEVMPGARIIRRKSGNAYAEGISGKNYFAQDFREIRKHVFPKDARQFLDIRRSGNVEADAAGADKETMGELLANGLASSKFLEGTYTPPTVTKARQVALQRIEGRKRLAVEIERLSGRSKSIA
tara:strand:+ start:10724 stop:11806 length:1083 start_codon:yes stop_codon:yes gene_type:complete